MASGAMGAVCRQLERVFSSGGVTGLSEGQLLDRFVTRRDDVAFEALVARHGPMVMGVCRRLLRDPNDVDDAFQATFLVLVRKPRTRRRRDRHPLGSGPPRAVVTLASAATALDLLGRAAPAALPERRVIPTVQAESQVAAGQAAAGIVSVQAAALCEGVVHAMSLRTIK